MKIDWSLAVTLVIAIVLGAVIDRMLLKRQVVLVTASNVSMREPSSITEYVQRHYPNAL